MPKLEFRSIKFVTCLLIIFITNGCNTADRIQNVGKIPHLNSNLQENNIYQYGDDIEELYNNNPSLWQSNNTSFLQNHTTRKYGDIIKINVKFSDDAKLANASQRQRKTTENLLIPRLFGAQKHIKEAFSGEDDKPETIASLSGSNTNLGKGAIDRSEKINMQIAAMVMKNLPNGNLYVQGTQEIRVNYEVREVYISGIIRPEDISIDNSVDASKIAELRISYGGRGHMSDIQQPRIGIQLIDILSPF